MVCFNTPFHSRPHPPSVVVSKAQQLCEDYIVASVRHGIDPQTPVVDGQWVRRWRVDRGVSFRKPNRKWKVPKDVLLERQAHRQTVVTALSCVPPSLSSSHTPHTHTVAVLALRNRQGWGRHGIPGIQACIPRPRLPLPISHGRGALGAISHGRGARGAISHGRGARGAMPRTVADDAMSFSEFSTEDGDEVIRAARQSFYPTSGAPSAGQVPAPRFPLVAKGSPSATVVALRAPMGAKEAVLLRSCLRGWYYSPWIEANQEYRASYEDLVVEWSRRLSVHERHPSVRLRRSWVVWSPHPR